MSHYLSRPDPGRNLAGIAAVVVFHVGVVYALVSGLATKVVDVIRSPIETRIIEEIVEPPKKQEVKIEPVVKPPPPPPYVPPPEVTIQSPPPPEPTIAVTPTPPPVVQDFKPSPPPVVEAPPAPPKPAAVSVAVACPTRALPKLTPKQEGVPGSVKARLTIKGGKVVQVDILQSTPRGLFDAVVRNAILQYGCQSEGDQVLVAEQTFNFTAE